MPEDCNKIGVFAEDCSTGTILSPETRLDFETICLSLYIAKESFYQI